MITELLRPNPQVADVPEEPARPYRMAIDVRPLSGSVCGYTIHLLSVIDALRRANFDLTLITNRPVVLGKQEIAGIPLVQFGSHSQMRWEFVDLPKYLGEEDYEVYLSNANRGIPWRKNPRTRYVLGLLDIIPYKFPRMYLINNFFYRLRNHHYNERVSQLISVYRADAIVTISECSERDIKSFFRRRNVKSCLIRLKDVARPARVAPKDQFAYVGGLELRKRLDVLLRAFARFVADHPGYRLKLIGAHYDGVDAQLAELGIAESVDRTGYVDHETKFRIIGESRAMVYPSIYEGYGMAIAEGMQAGVPVIAGPGGAQAEIGGDAVRYVEPTSADDILAAMKEMLDPAARDAWIARGEEQLAVLADPQVDARLVAYFREQGRLSRSRRERRGWARTPETAPAGRGGLQTS